MLPKPPLLRLLFLEVDSRHLSISKGTFFLFCFVTCQQSLLEWRIGSCFFSSDFAQPVIFERWMWIMWPRGQRLVWKATNLWNYCETGKVILNYNFPPSTPPPCPLNPISIPLGCCWGCRNIPSPLANYCPARTCDLRQEESSLQALVLGAGGVWSLVSCPPPQFDIPRPSENGWHLYSSHTQELHNVGQRQM